MAKDRSEDKPVARNAAQFATTHWSVVLAAGDSTSPDSREALEKLCRTYWLPLYAFVRRKGYSQEDAKDLTQAFFAEFLERHAVGSADPSRGRFRTFLLACMQNFLGHQRERATALKRRGVAVPWLDVTEGDRVYQEASAETESPEELFERRWALRLLEVVLGQLREEFSRSSSVDLFDQLKLHLWRDEAAVPYRELGAVHRLSEGALRVTVHRLRMRYRELLRTEIAHTVPSPNEVDDEIRHLRLLLTG